jgi:hypothetical protein
MKRATTAAILRAYERYFQQFGQPKKILSDLGTQFTSHAYKKKLVDLQIKAVYTSVRHPSSNPVERYMREIGRLCRCYCSENHQSWVHHLEKFEHWLNAACHRSTGISPRLLQLGAEEDIVKRLVKFPAVVEPTKGQLIALARRSIEKQAKIRKLGHKLKEVRKSTFVIGQLVWIKSNFQSSALHQEAKKFFPLYVGPYTVLKILHWDTFLLGDPQTKVERGIFNSSLLKPAYERN